MPKDDYQAKKPIEGTRLWLVGKYEVPVVDMDKDSIFSSNVSWLIQEALGCSGRAEGQFEYCDDRMIVEDCSHQLGLHPDDMSVARLCREDLRHLKAVGVTGKRSVMMACLVALYRDPGRRTMNHKAFWKALQEYQLEKAWERLMATVEEEEDAWKAYNSNFNSYGSYGSYGNSGGYGNSGPKEKPTSKWEGHGVNLKVVLDNVPVVDMQTHSIFHGNASWLLQAACGSCSKADALFEYVQDREILAECGKKMRLSKDELSIARLKNRPDLVAVGTTGKRSVMFALCILLAYDDKNAATLLESDMQECDKTLVEPMADVLLALHARIGSSKEPNLVAGGRGGNHHGQGYGGGYDSQRWAPETSRRASYQQASASRSPRRKPPRREKKPRLASPNAEELDEQLKEYMAQKSNRTRD